MRASGLIKRSGGLSAVRGLRAAGVACGLKANGRPDLALVVADHPATLGATFTLNLVQAAPVQLSRRRARGGRFSAIVLNSGNANACTGRQGLHDAEAMAAAVAKAVQVPEAHVFVASTGVIGRRLPMAQVQAGIAEAARRLSPAGGSSAARAIMTTDTVKKESAVAFTVGRQQVTVGGMAKGSGMIAPHMATMLAVLATDAQVAARPLQQVLKRAVEASFNRITVDGDTSTNDMVLCFATGAAGAPPLRVGTPAFRRFSLAVERVCRELATMMVRDGEGVTKLVELRVAGARNDAEARRAAETVANSPLVKTTLYGEDMNWGRIMAALGRAGIHFHPDAVDIGVDDIPVVRRGLGLGARAEAAANRRLKRREFMLGVHLHAGTGESWLLTADLTEAYVKINAGYRS